MRTLLALAFCLLGCNAGAASRASSEDDAGTATEPPTGDAGISGETSTATRAPGRTPDSGADAGVAADAATPSSVGNMLPQGYKFDTGDWFEVPQYGMDYTGFVSALGSYKGSHGNTYKGLKGAVWGVTWAEIESGSGTTVNGNKLSDAQNGVGQYAFFSEIGQAFNYLQSVVPGANMSIYLNEAFGPGSGFGAIDYGLPEWLLNCGGKLVVPNHFGSTETTTYTNIAKQPNGQYGWGAYAWTGAATNAYSAWDAGASYADGAYVTYDGLYYHSMTAVAAGGEAPKGNSAWKEDVYNVGTIAFWDPAIARSWANLWEALAQYQLPAGTSCAGMTLDACPLIQYVANNDETSMTFDSGPVEVAYTDATNQPTPANFWAGYTTWARAATAAFPHTRIGTCMGSSFASRFGQTNSPAAWIPVITTLFGKGGITGLSFSASDALGDQEVFTHGTDARRVFAGQDPGATDLRGSAPYWGQIEPEDYSMGLNTGVANYTAQAALDIMGGIHLDDASDRSWSFQDDNFGFGANWVNIYYPELINVGQSTYPLNSDLPTSLLDAPSHVATSNANSGTVRVSWDATKSATPVTYSVFANGAAVATGVTELGTTVGGLGSGTHVVTVAKVNRNGTGASSTAVTLVVP
jgi:hypothetical protein